MLQADEERDDSTSSSLANIHRYTHEENWEKPAQSVANTTFFT
jgi:MFS superfamily sulfate permease-like transporter